MQTKDKYFNNFNSVCKKEDKMFMSVLYHNERGGFACLCDKTPERFFVRYRLARNYSGFEVKQSADTDVYVSLNTFKSRKRGENNLYNKSVFYIDIDLHTDENDNEEELKKVCDALSNAYDTGILNIPTMITFTGRGLGIYYVLEKTVHCNTENTKKMEELFLLTYKTLIMRYEKLFERTKDCHAVVDKAVMDASRIARLPSTINSKNKKTCHLVFVNRDENGEVVYAKDFKDVSVIIFPKKVFYKNTVSYTDEKKLFMLRDRIEKIFKLAEVRKSEKNPKRELMCHMVYNFCIQSGYGEKKAKEVMRRLNGIFVYPLPESELKAASSSVSDEKNYFYTNKQMVDKLGITDKEQEMISFTGCSMRKITRANQKYETKMKKAKRDYEIACYINEHEDVTLADVAELFHVGKTTVNNIVKEYGLGRNERGHVKKEELEFFYKQNVQKFGTILWCDKKKETDFFSGDGATTEAVQSGEGNSDLLKDKNKETVNDNETKEQTKKEAEPKEFKMELEEELKIPFHYADSFLNFMIAHTIKGYQNFFKTFKMEFDNCICDTTDLKKRRAVILFTAGIGKAFEEEYVIEKAFTPLKSVLLLIKGEKKLTTRSVVSFTTTAPYKTLSLREAEEIKYDKTVFVQHLAKDEEKKEEVVHDEFVTATSEFNPFEVADNKRKTKRKKEGKKYYRGQEIFEVFDVEGAIKKWKREERARLKYASGKIYKPRKLSEAQKRNAEEFELQRLKWKYVGMRKSNTTFWYSRVYSDLKRMEEEEDNGKILIKGKGYTPTELRKKYLNKVYKEDLAEIEKECKDKTSATDLVERIIERVERNKDVSLEP